MMADGTMTHQHFGLNGAVMMSTDANDCWNVDCADRGTWMANDCHDDGDDDRDRVVQRCGDVDRPLNCGRRLRRRNAVGRRRCEELDLADICRRCCRCRRHCDDCASVCVRCCDDPDDNDDP